VFLCASEPQALIAHPAVSRRPNEGMAGEHLSVVTSTTDTLFADVQRLPPAGRAIVTPDRSRVDTYWTIDTSREIRYATTTEYGEHLHALLRDAVRVRLRSSTNVGVLLSGGVDSSSILGLAHALRHSGEVTVVCDAWSIRTEGVVDETPFITQVVEKSGCRSHMFGGDLFTAAAYNLSARERADVPAAPTCRLADTLKSHARQSGTRVLLSGFWGDEWFSGSEARGADLLRSFRWLALAREARARSAGPEGLGPGALFKRLVWPLLSRPLRRRIKTVLGRDGVPPWVRPDFARRVSLADRIFPVDPDAAFPSIAQRDIYREAGSGTAVLTTEDEDRTAAAFGVETRHPFADRRVMEFGLAIPEDLRCRGGVRKFILRDAMRAYLPDDVCGRVTSPEASAVFLEPIREWIDAGLLRAARTTDQGWVDVQAVNRLDERVFSRYRAGDPSYAWDIWPLWSVLAVEVWMREVVDARTIEEA
jgi:asparagine synthase (glutamine-hydrolysing)